MQPIKWTDEAGVALQAADLNPADTRKHVESGAFILWSDKGSDYVVTGIDSDNNLTLIGAVGQRWFRRLKQFVILANCAACGGVLMSVDSERMVRLGKKLGFAVVGHSDGGKYTDMVLRF